MGFSLGEYQDMFLEEADELLQELNQNLLKLEKNPSDDEIINNIFRAAHSLKSSAAFVGLTDLGDLAHKMENLLQGIRDKVMKVTPAIVDVLFQCFDVINDVIREVSSGNPPSKDFSSLIKKIESVGKQGNIQEEKKEAPAPKRIQLSTNIIKDIRDGINNGLSCCEIAITLDPDAAMKSLKVQLVLTNLEKIADILITIPSIEEVSMPEFDNRVQIILLTSATVEELKKACEVDQVTRIDLRKIELVKKDNKVALKYHEQETLFEEKPEADTKARDVEEDVIPDEEEKDEIIIRSKDDKKTLQLRTVKVSVEKLDQLLNNVGELVIANSGFYKLYEEMRRLNIEKSIINEFKNRMEQMSRIAKDLQSGIMKTRMVPIGQVFSRFNRLVRDLAKEFDKKVVLEIKGEETELDKKVIDVIGEPLMHLIRNAVDHGVESVEERRQQKKPEIATITLNAYQGGNQIFVEVSDDGKGLDLKKIKAKAIEKGLASPEMIANMDKEEIYNFIFTPGFSTSDVVTDISGRGVGMNVVQETVNELNGSVAIESEPGMGTRFILSFPLTLAIIPAIMVRVQRELYAIPLSDVIETIKILPEEITTIEGHEVINLRGEILSLIRLNNFVGIESGLKGNERMPVVVVGYGNRKIGIVVDLLEGKQEIVIKSLEQNYRTVAGLAGASILGDGSICLILDISSMINKVIMQQDTFSFKEKQRVLGAKQASVEVVKTEVATKEQPVKETVDVQSKKEIGETLLAKEMPIKEDIVFKKEPEEIVEVEEYKEPEKNYELKRGKDTVIEEKVHSVLEEFKTELKEKIKDTLDKKDEIYQKLGISDDDLAKVQVLANVGITDAAESLSKIINRRVDLSIPDVSVLAIESIPQSFGDVDSVYLGVYMPIVGQINGTILFSLREDSGYELVDMLLGLPQGTTDTLTEDGESVLKEVTNIVGSAVVNAFADKIEMAIKPTVPSVVHDYMQSILDSILAFHTAENEYALVMDTEFFHQDDRVIGKLLIMPTTSSLATIVERLRN
ncbi:MAG TPA: chemotaxis protein CheW [Spirochaetota bacterium]|nr:chemotaxis protein CheW [Spirochaetota bacterium]HOM10265.1 chemotaxis protein CheW [Spirochaetota bacterium]HPP50494.1 chemotaxis protein CheW [Spirochaetota bacterium]HXK64694.1 chemotaxis protein CheW [Spirochaetota bacterium]